MAGGVSIGPRIQVAGEEKYRQQIKEIIEQSKTLDAEMKALTASFAEDATAQEKATATSKLLNEQLEAAHKRTELVREMTEQATKAKGEDNVATLKWRQALATAKEEQAKLERAVEENNKALEDQGEAMEDAGKDITGLGNGLDSIASKFGIQIPDAAKEALNGVAGFSTGTVTAMVGAAAAIGGAYEVGKKLVAVTVEAAAQADALLTRSAQTGLDTGLLQGLDYASRFLDFENVDKTLVKFTQSMASAEEGAKSQAEAFEKLGISIEDEDGNLRNNWETFQEAIDALGQIENATERDAIANDLFGKSYVEMKPLVDAGTGALQEYLDEAQRLGYIIDDEVVKNLGALDDAMQRNEASAESLKNKVSGELAPAVTEAVDLWTGFLDFLGEAVDYNTSDQKTIDIARRYGVVIDESMLLAAKTTELAETTDESSDKMAAAIEAATESATADIQALREAYDASYEAAKKSLDGQFGLWEQAGEVTATSTGDMLAGLQSQIDYWNEYESNFNALVSRNIEGIEEFARNFDDGSQASAEALAGLKNATDEEIRKVMEKMAEVGGVKSNIAKQFADLETDVSGSLKTIEDNYATTVSNLNNKTGEIDFAPFDAAVEAAFGGMETRAQTAADNAVATVQEAINQINSMQISPQIEQSTIYSDMNAGYNAAGTDSWRGGLTWVGESGPELVRLPQGTQIIPNQQSMQIASAGTDTRAMEGLLGQVVNLLGEIRAERQAESMRGRMR